MSRLVTAAAALTLSLTTAIPVPALAQASTIPGVMTICTDVINLQYEGDRSRDLQCIGAVSDFLDAIGAASSEADPQIAELVIQLLELYREDPECKIADTELPEAIQTAASQVLDEEVKAEYLLIYDQLENCDFSPTAAIEPDPDPASDN